MNNSELIEQNIASNIANLRKAKGWKQSEFAEKINFSDKSVSKWERAESMPDIATLKLIADIFGVSLDYLTQEHTQSQIKYQANKFSVRDLLIVITTCIAVLGIATVIFITANIMGKQNAQNYWIAYLYASALCAAIVTFYTKVENIWLGRLISLSSCVWILITSIFMTLLLRGYPQFWMLYLIGVPIEAAICLLFFVKRN